MPRLIDAYKVRIDRDDFDTYSDYITALDAVTEAPTVDAEPVRHGKWIAGKSADHVRCGFCNKDYDWTMEAQYYNFCPTCGHWMGEE